MMFRKTQGAQQIWFSLWHIRRFTNAFFCSATVDTCTAMGEWVRYPYAETALSNVLPCVDEQTTNHTLYQSKVVVYQLVNIVNTAISSSVNSDTSSREKKTYSYNQSGPMVPYLCSPYDFHLQNRQCNPDEASVANASLVCKQQPLRIVLSLIFLKFISSRRIEK